MRLFRPFCCVEIKKTSTLLGEYLLFGFINKGKFRGYAFTLVPCVVLHGAIDLIATHSLVHHSSAPQKATAIHRQTSA